MWITWDAADVSLDTRYMGRGNNIFNLVQAHKKKNNKLQSCLAAPEKEEKLQPRDYEY